MYKYLFSWPFFQEEFNIEEKKFFIRWMHLHSTFKSVFSKYYIIFNSIFIFRFISIWMPSIPKWIQLHLQPIYSLNFISIEKNTQYALKSNRITTTTTKRTKNLNIFFLELQNQFRLHLLFGEKNKGKKKYEKRRQYESEPTHAHAHRQGISKWPLEYQTENVTFYFHRRSIRTKEMDL